MSTVQCIVVTPEETVRDEQVEMVVLPLYDGEIGICPGHSAMIGRLGYGEMRLTAGGTTTRWYVDGGFVQVADNVVSVLTQRAVAAEELDAEVITERLAAAESQTANSPELFARRDRAVAQSRAQLRIARRVAGG